jgi:hypothetical protein
LDRKTSQQQNATPAQPEAADTTQESPEVVETDGERGRNRTYNLLIKSQLLCQLSYAPTACSNVGTNFNYIITFCGVLRAQSRCSPIFLDAISISSSPAGDIQNLGLSDSDSDIGIAATSHRT